MPMNSIINREFSVTYSCCLLFCTGRKKYIDYLEKMSLIRKHKCLQAVRTDLYFSSIPLPLKARALTISDSLFQHFFNFLCENLWSLLPFSLRGRLKGVKFETLKLFVKHLSFFLTLKDGCFHVNVRFQNGSSWGAVVEKTLGMDRS